MLIVNFRYPLFQYTQFSLIIEEIIQSIIIAPMMIRMGVIFFISRTNKKKTNKNAVQMSIQYKNQFSIHLIYWYEVSLNQCFFLAPRGFSLLRYMYEYAQFGVYYTHIMWVGEQLIWFVYELRINSWIHTDASPLLISNDPIQFFFICLNRFLFSRMKKKIIIFFFRFSFVLSFDSLIQMIQSL